MPVKAMEIVTASAHPNADTLRVYGLASADSDNILCVVANLENIYKKGDVVVVALLGAILADGTKISKITLRGVGSYGMILGKTEAEVGTNLTTEFCHPEYKPNLSARHVKWPEIELLHNILLGMDKRREHMGEEFLPPTVTYRAKIKLHGVNGAVQLVGGGVVAQSRTIILEGGGKGFYQWVQDNRNAFLAKTIPGKYLTLFGEWCGPGVQKGVAISKTDRKVFVVFGAQIGLDQEATLEVRPEVLQKLVPKHPDIFVLPWYGPRETLSFGDRDTLAGPVDRMNQLVRKVEEEDPWVKEVFGVSGMGEGLVWYPDPEEALPWYCPYHEMLFKTKGEKHAVVKQRQPVQIDPEVVESISGFADIFVTENRLEQILSTSIDGTPTRKDTGTFLKAFQQDVCKESTAELGVAGLDWKQVSREVNTRARLWFFEQIPQ